MHTDRQAGKQTNLYTQCVENRQTFKGFHFITVLQQLRLQSKIYFVLIQMKLLFTRVLVCWCLVEFARVLVKTWNEMHGKEHRTALL